MTDYILSAAKPIARRGIALPSLVRALYARWRHWHRLRRDHAALLRQPDHLLRDIGLDRRDIERAIRGSHWMR